MIIFDFNYLETVPEGTDIIGGGKRKKENKQGTWQYQSEATAFADSNADVIGRNTKTVTKTEATAVVDDVFSIASSNSYAKVDLSP
ncbi:MAG: hypothetical protein BRC59_07305 [Cyanobacteria bacterium SW_4_48_29]|nr:MAG: hypothetical protein BRC39_11555 [Cyanobacteria bacterium QH_7_48_89]PSP29744.1 MAG: hypothetical protein BRC59_07305 [Cyanobacteria bacterium SW_4_48_29]